MEDRSFTATSATALTEKIHAWSEWSARVGLLESEKDQATAFTPQQRERLLAAAPPQTHPNFCVDNVDFLGVVAHVSKPRKLAPTEEVRLHKAHARLTLSSHLRLPADVFAQYARFLNINGWLARMPTEAAIKSCGQLSKTAKVLPKWANSWLYGLWFMEASVTWELFVLAIFSDLSIRSGECSWLGDQLLSFADAFPNSFGKEKPLQPGDMNRLGCALSPKMC